MHGAFAVVSLKLNLTDRSVSLPRSEDTTRRNVMYMQISPQLVLTAWCPFLHYH